MKNILLFRVTPTIGESLECLQIKTMEMKDVQWVCHRGSQGQNHK